MNNKIDEIRRGYIYTVQPVKLFENNQQQGVFSTQNPFNFVSRTEKSEFNLLHPNSKTNTKGQNLDLMF